MSRIKAILLGVIFVLLAFSEVVTPMVTSMLIDRALNRAAPSDKLDVVVGSFPGIFMWLGRFDSVRVGAEGAKIDGLKVQASQLILEDARLDMSALLKQGQVKVQESRNLEFVLRVTEQDLAAYIGAKVKEAKNPSVKILTDKIQIRSEIDLGIAKLAVGADGRIVGDAKSIRFVSDRLEIKNTGGINFGAVFGEIPLVDLTRLPFKVGVRKVVTEPGVLLIYADNHE